jgi:hypothetical protein
LQSRVLGFGLLQDGNVSVGVFPEGEEILVGGERTDAGSIGIRSLPSAPVKNEAILAGLGRGQGSTRARW